jgi:galactose-1-phosphate uridylyltransferase
LVQAELEDGRRLLHTRPSVVAFCPFAPRAAFEVWIAPTFDTSFFALSDSAVSQIGSLLHGVVQAQAAALGTPAYNAAICMAHGPHRPPGYRWLLKVVPRIVPGAAMERIVGLDLVTASPETAARVLRSVAPRAATPAS